VCWAGVAADVASDPAAHADCAAVAPRQSVERACHHGTGSVAVAGKNSVHFLWLLGSHGELVGILAVVWASSAAARKSAAVDRSCRARAGTGLLAAQPRSLPQKQPPHPTRESAEFKSLDEPRVTQRRGPGHHPLTRCWPAQSSGCLHGEPAGGSHGVSTAASGRSLAMRRSASCVS